MKQHHKTIGWKAFALGITLAGATCAALSLLPVEYALESLTLILAAVGAVYFGTALSVEKRETLLLESSIALVFIALALLGLWYSPLILALGYFLHGLWDYLHHSWQIGAQIKTSWYPPFCMGYDWLVGTFILFKYI